MSRDGNSIHDSSKHSFNSNTWNDGCGTISLFINLSQHSKLQIPHLIVHCSVTYLLFEKMHCYLYNRTLKFIIATAYLTSPLQFKLASGSIEKLELGIYPRLWTVWCSWHLSVTLLGGKWSGWEDLHGNKIIQNLKNKFDTDWCWPNMDWWEIQM